MSTTELLAPFVLAFCIFVALCLKRYVLAAVIAIFLTVTFVVLGTTYFYVDWAAHWFVVFGFTSLLATIGFIALERDRRAYTKALEGTKNPSSAS